jgi:hypothetical protein
LCREFEPGPRVALQGAQERGEQIFEAVAVTENPGFLERRASRECLEGLDEAVGVASFEESIDRPRSPFDQGSAAVAVPLVPEAQGRHEDLIGCPPMREPERLDTPVPVRQRDHGVGRAKIDADRDIGGWNARHGGGSGRRRGGGPLAHRVEKWTRFSAPNDALFSKGEHRMDSTFGIHPML